MLVIETAGGYVAWTGSPRIAAARVAELQKLPCLIVPEAELGPEYSAKHGHVFDYDPLKILLEMGNEPAIKLMWFENKI